MQILGEVFTPTAYAHNLAGLISRAEWADENRIFFEIGVGTGNILLEVAERRIHSLTKKYQRNGREFVCASAVATALVSLWGVDICFENVKICRSRLFAIAFAHIKNELEKMPLVQRKLFLIHLIGAITWHIREEDYSRVLRQRQVHVELGERQCLRAVSQFSFGLTWEEIVRTKSKEKGKWLPLLSAQRCLSRILAGPARGIDDFMVADELRKKITILLQSADRKARRAS